MVEHELRLSCAHSTFPKLSFEAALTVIRDLGFSAVDVCSFSGYEHIPPETVLDDPERAAAEVRVQLDRAGLVPSDVFAIVGSSFEELAPNHPDAGVRAESLRQFERFLTFTESLEAPGLTILPGANFEGVDEDESLALAASELNRRAGLAGNAGIRLAFEPHYGSVSPTPERALKLLESTPEVGVALDYSHFVFQGIPETRIDPLLPRTEHLHVRQARPEAIQTRTDEGTIDFVRIRDELLALGYDGYFALEYQWDPGWLDFSHVDCISETAETRDVLLTGNGSG